MKYSSVLALIFSVVAMAISIHTEREFRKISKVQLAVSEQLPVPASVAATPATTSPCVSAKDFVKLPGLEHRLVLTKETYMGIYFEQRVKNEQAMLQHLFKIKGVTAVKIDELDIGIVRDAAFDWDKLSPQIGKVLDEALPQATSKKSTAL